MQDATGTGGLLLKVGSDNHSWYSLPGNDINKRYYVPECTSSSLSGALLFALAATIYKGIGKPSTDSFASDLKLRAINAWERSKNTTDDFTTFEVDCDDQNIIAGDADQSSYWQKQCALAAAAYLFEATGQ